MKKFKEVPHVKGAIQPKIEGVFPQLEYNSVLDMIDSIVEDNNNKQFAIEMRKVALHIENEHKRGAAKIANYDAIIQFTGVPTKVIDSLEENLNRPLSEVEILEVGIQIGFAIARGKEGMQQELNAGTKMLLDGIIQHGFTSAQIAEKVIVGRIDALNLIRRAKGDPLKALLSLLSKHIN